MSEHAGAGAKHGPSHRLVEMGVAVAMALFALIVVAGSTAVGIGWGVEGPKAGFFPFYVGLIILGCSIFNFIQVAVVPSTRLFADWGQLRLVLSVLIPTTVYVSLVPVLGIYVSSMMLVAVFMRWLGQYGWSLIATIAIGVPVVFFVVFERWFLVPLPKGPIENLLGF